MSYNSKQLKVQSSAKKLPKPKDVIYDPMGQWKFPGQITKIPSGNITMQGVPYPVLGKDNLGNEIMMQTDKNYQFPGTSVTEYPQFQKGGDYNMLGYAMHHPIGALKHFINPEKYHATDEYKKPNHITFSDESKYSNQEHKGGHWEKQNNGTWTFTPSSWNIKNAEGYDKLQDWWSQNEGKSGNILLPPSDDPQIKLGGWLNSYEEEYKKGGQKGLKKFTSKNIQTSLNDIMQRNTTLFGPSGKKRYKPDLNYKYGGWLEQYQGDQNGSETGTGKEVTSETNNFKSERDFLIAMANSSLFTDRYKNMTGGINNEETESFRKNVINNINNAKINVGITSTGKPWTDEGSLGAYVNQFPEAKDYIKNGVIPDNYDKFLYTNKGFPHHNIFTKNESPTVITHELSHASTFGDNLLSQFSPKLSKLKENESFVKKYSEPDYNRATEHKAYLDEIRKYLYENKIYDAIKNNFTEDDYNKVIKERSKLNNKSDVKSAFDAILDPYDKDEVIKMFNSYTSSGKNNKQLPIAKYGGWLEQYQNKGPVSTNKIGSILGDDGRPMINVQPEVVIEDENSWLDKLKTTLNPYNWGVDDYTKSGTKGQAYNAARKAGRKEYMWNNERFSTDMEGTPAQQLQWSGITNSQTANKSLIPDVNFVKDRLEKNLIPVGYDHPFNRVYSAIVNNKKLPVDVGNNRKVEENDVNSERADAYKLYMSKPQKNNTFAISNYNPSIRDESDYNNMYYKINNMYGNPNKDDAFVNFIYETNKENVRKGWEPMRSQENVMGHFKYSLANDDRGNYMSYYDKWDLNPFKLKNPFTKKEINTDFGKPFEIYDRIYFKDYGDGKDKRMYYTDNELKSFSTDKNAKNFDTIALQKELYNRGYKLPESVTVDPIIEGEEISLHFDGIYGDETKNALLDWQNKNKKKKYGGNSNNWLDQYQGGNQVNTSNWKKSSKDSFNLYNRGEEMVKWAKNNPNFTALEHNKKDDELNIKYPVSSMPWSGKNSFIGATNWATLNSTKSGYWGVPLYDKPVGVQKEIKQQLVVSPPVVPPFVIPAPVAVPKVQTEYVIRENNFGPPIKYRINPNTKQYYPITDIPKNTPQSDITTIPFVNEMKKYGGWLDQYQGGNQTKANPLLIQAFQESLANQKINEQKVIDAKNQEIKNNPLGIKTLTTARDNTNVVPVRQLTTLSNIEADKKRNEADRLLKQQKKTQGTLRETPKEINPNEAWRLAASNYQGHDKEEMNRIINSSKTVEGLGALAGVTGGGLHALVSIPAVANTLGLGFAAHGVHSLPSTYRTLVDPNESVYNKARALTYNTADFLGMKQAAEALKGIGTAGKWAYNNAARSVALSKESGLLSNTRKLNPWAFKPNETNWYRQVGKSAIDDAFNTGIVREAGEEVSPRMFQEFQDQLVRMQGSGMDAALASRRPASPFFGKGELFYPMGRKPTINKVTGKLSKNPAGKGSADYLIETALPNESFQPAYVKGMGLGVPTETGATAILKPDPSLRNLENFNIYKKDWLRGYKEVPKQLPGSPNVASSVDDVAINLESQIAKLKKQQVLSEESRKALWSDYKAGNITAEEYTSLYKELNQNGLLESRSVLEKQLKDYNIKQEIVNTPQQNILKSENQLGKNIAEAGISNKGVFELGDNHVARLSAHGYDDASRLVKYSDKIKSPRIAKTLQVKELNGEVYQVQEKVIGTPVERLTETELQNIPKEHIDNFLKDKAELEKLGLYIDFDNVNSNMLYNSKKGFQFIDLGISPVGNNMMASNELFVEAFPGLKLPGSLKKFKSEIDWSKWNKEISNNPQLIKEYNAIEQQAKANGTWMKNPDGSPTKLPNGKLANAEQWIQAQSNQWEKAYGSKGFDNVGEMSRGYHNDITQDAAKYYPEGRSIFGGDDATGMHYSPKKQIVTANTEQKGVFNLIYPKNHKGLKFDGKGSPWTEIPVDSKLGIENRWNGVKGAYRKNYSDEQIVRTDDIAYHLEKNNLPYARIENIFDGFPAKHTTVVNNKPGNYLKSLWGNNGMFDMTNPNIYKSLLPVGLGTAAALIQEKKYGGTIKKVLKKDVNHNEKSKFVNSQNSNWLNKYQ